MCEISNEQTAWYTKQIFIDPTIQKLSFEAKRACDRVGINPADLKEKTLEEFKFNSKFDSDSTE